MPNPEAHRDLILSALNRAAVSPADISYIEAHGTGTALGDPIEIRGLSMAFDKQTDEKNDCGIGSVKSNIGHLEAAAGIAGLIKVLLSMKHETLPASLHSEELNRKISFLIRHFMSSETTGRGRLKEINRESPQSVHSAQEALMPI